MPDSAIPQNGLEIGIVRPEDRGETVRRFFAERERPGGEPQVANDLTDSVDGTFVGMIEARRAGRQVGAVWIQPQPGATAVLWPPELEAGEPEPVARALMEEACRLAAARQVVLVQVLLEQHDQRSAARLTTAGFVHMADLLYLASSEQHFPLATPEGVLHFEHYTPQKHDRLARIVQETYKATRDCPRLGAARDIQDVLAGYRATGQFDPARWLIAREARADAGCLLLTDHPTAKALEVVYMGLVPHMRGRGLGLQLVCQAQWIARRAGRRLLLLAVDKANHPARALYMAAGFVGWDERRVFMRQLRPTSPRSA